MGTEVEEARDARRKGGVAPTQMESFAAAIVGGGQAGLATSRELTKAGLEHVVLERGQVGQTWGEPMGQLLPRDAQLDDPAT